MPINGETAKKLFVLLFNVAKETAIQAHRYLGCHNKITGYLKYPVREKMFLRDEPELLEKLKETPYVLFDIPKYELVDFPKERIEYGFMFFPLNVDHIDIELIDGYSELRDYINQNQNLTKLIFNDNRLELLDYKVKSIISEIVVRYLYSINATPSIPDVLDDKLKPFVEEKLSRYINPQLEIDIYVPICLATFEDDNIKLSDQVEIIRIPEDIQKSREEACHFEINFEDWLASCATHMIVLHNHYFENNEYISVYQSTHNYRKYPLHTIDEIMAIIRVVTGYNIGYKQILCRPLGWVDSFCADLTPLYGAKCNFVNTKEAGTNQFYFPVCKISPEQALEIKKLHGY